MELNKLFDNIMDLPGIEGACLFNLEGSIHLNRMPAFLANELFQDAQRRITAMYETMDENFLPCDDYLLKFSEKWLMLRRHDQEVLLVMANDKANLASARMVTNMTLKHLTPETLGNLPEPTPFSAAAAPTADPAPVNTPHIPEPIIAAKPLPEPMSVAESKPAKPVRLYRGQPY